MDCQLFFQFSYLDTCIVDDDSNGNGVEEAMLEIAIIVMEMEPFMASSFPCYSVKLNHSAP